MYTKGQTLIELIVVVSVSVIVVGALVFATIASLRNSQFSKYQSQATKLAQDGIEKVRSGRDRNQCVIYTGSSNINSWNGNNTACSVINTASFWSTQIQGNCIPNCYFNVSDQGALTYIAASQDIPTLAESKPPFHRVVILSDDSTTYGTQKTVTVIVRWTDFSGDHQSQLTTVLGKL